MPPSTGASQSYSYGSVDEAAYRRFRQAMGLPGKAGPAIRSLEKLQSEVDPPPTDELAETGRAVRAELTEPLDASLIEAELSALEDAFEEIPALEETGVPEYGETPYRDLTTAAWRLEEHLAETGFFESAEDSLPAFTPEHVETTTRQLLQTEVPTATLSELDFDEREQLALVTNIVNASERVSWWQPTGEYPPVDEPDGYDEGVVYENVPPLHERAMAGALLWIDGLDWHLWQNEVLITESMIERGIWDVKTMLAGVYLVGDAARRVAEGAISDEDLTTTIAAGTAVAIVGQAYLTEDIVWIDDEERKPRAESTGGD